MQPLPGPQRVRRHVRPAAWPSGPTVSHSASTKVSAALATHPSPAPNAYAAHIHSHRAASPPSPRHITSSFPSAPSEGGRALPAEAERAARVEHPVEEAHAHQTEGAPALERVARVLVQHARGAERHLVPAEERAGQVAGATFHSNAGQPRPQGESGPLACSDAPVPGSCRSLAGARIPPSFAAPAPCWYQSQRHGQQRRRPPATQPWRDRQERVAAGS